MAVNFGDGSTVFDHPRCHAMHPTSLDPVRPAPRTLPEALNELFVVLEDLLKRIADTDDTHIRNLRARVRAEMIAVQREMASRAAPVRTLEPLAGASRESGQAIPRPP